ncbi:hypothetical protein FGADI_12496 [Fusarium gaditjirri]|uniref:Uncharacterized protein n=1 Tax=Fusarium gaditjirri TaxID=282569 RepID=A0A8H4SS11_9HYPO|nr:hypothetical protein FGADI_12496 [Fusarium gaditjirri]
MSTTVLLELEKFLEPMFEDVELDFEDEETLDRGKLCFGHIQIPPYRLGKVSLMESVRQICMKANPVNTRKPEVLFVVSDIERDLGMRAQEDGKSTPVILTFSELFEALRVSKEGATNSQWATASSILSWQKGQVLPLNVVLVICLDPHMSADCALCLLGVVEWASKQVKVWDDADICVLTLSAEKEFNFLSKVVSFSAPDMQVASVDLSAHGQQDPTTGSLVIGAPGNNGYAGRILQELRARMDHRRLILSFDEKLGEQFQQQLGETERQTVEFRTVQATVDVGALRHLERRETGPKTLFITFQGEVPFLPLEIEGFDELHLVLGTSGIFLKGWDESSRRIIKLPHWASKEDRHLQHWWIRQPSIQSRTIYTGSASLPQFLQAGGPRRRLVEDVQLGGFIASLADIASWGIDTGAALSCFVRQSERYEDMSNRLHIQRLITKDGLGLSQTETEVFRGIISFLGYDHGLALFVALDCGPEARRVKVQLAFMLKHGTDQIISINKDVFNDRKKYNIVLRNCHGLGSSMARQGTMWLNLGLLKRHQKMVELDDAHDSQEDPLAGLVRFRSDRALFISNETGEALDCLVKLGINVDNARLVAQETRELSSEAKQEILLHLVRAFTHNLVVTENFSKNENDSPRLSHRLMSTWLELRQNERAKLIDINSYLKKDGACAFGICYDLARDVNGRHTFCDWTYIPGMVVAEWRSEFRSDATFYEILNTDVL